MKKLFVILFWLISISLSATDYYVKTGGNDSYTGLSDAQAWATIAKVNSVWAAGTFAPGDNIYFNKGDTFVGTLTPTESGTLANRITVSAYGTGDDPVFNGFTTITSWTTYGGGIYYASVPTESASLVVSLDDVHTAMGREPETGWIVYDSYVGSTQITDATLAGYNWVGAEVTIRTNMFVINHRPITVHSGTTITFSAVVFPLQAGNGFFIQNDLETLDTYGEWYYNNSTEVFYMYFGAETPGDHTVRVSSINNGINIIGRSYLTFENIELIGYNIAAINLDDTPYITVEDCTMSFSFNGIQGIGINGNTSTNCTFTGNIIYNINSCGIRLYGVTGYNEFLNATISYNTIYNIGLIRGGGEPLNIVSHYGICYDRTNGVNTSSIIEHNRITNVGYIGILFNVTNTEVRYNVVDGFNMILADGGGIYTHRLSTAASRVGYVHHNVVTNGYGDVSGEVGNDVNTCGLYGDASTHYIRWEYNIVANLLRYGSAGYFGNGNDYGTIKYNTFYNCVSGIEIPSATSHDYCEITNNIFFANTATQYSMYYHGSPDLSATCITDYNYYCRPITSDDNMIVWYRTDLGTVGYWNLGELQARRTQDVNSKDAPINISAEDDAHLVYNDTTISRNFTLSAEMVDLDNVPYSGVIAIDPWESLVLLGDGTIVPEEEVLPPEEEVVIPIVVTADVSYIKSISATCGGTVTYDGNGTITARGVCWAESANPTTADSHTNDGSGTGIFVSSITGLLPNTTYHVRAYAVNEEGTGYGGDKNFTTPYGLILFHEGKIVFKNGIIIVE